MSDLAALPATAFRAEKMLAAGPLHRVALAVRSATEAAPDLPVLVFDDGTGKVIDLDLRGGDSEILARLREGNDIAEADAARPAAVKARKAETRRRGPRG